MSSQYHLRTLANKLFGASPALADPVERHNAYLLAVLTLNLVVLGGIINLLLTVAYSGWWQIAFWQVWIVLGLLAITYGLSRTRYYAIGAVFAASLPPLYDYLYYLTTPVSTNIAPTFLIGTLIVSLLLSLRTTIAFIVVQTLFILSVPFLVPVFIGEWAYNLSLFVIISSLLVLGMHHRKRIAAKQRRQLLDAQQSVQASYDKLRQVMKNIPIMVVALDDDGQVVLWNREAERITGYKMHEVVAEPSLLHEQLNLPVVDGIFQVLWREKIDIVNRAGKQHTLGVFNMSSKYPIPGWSSWLVAIDMTALEHQEELMREYFRMSMSFRRENERNSLIQDMLSRLSHDLKIPFTVISLAADSVLRYGDRLSPTKHQEKLERISHQIGVATDILDDTIRTIREEAMQRAFQPEAVNLAALCQISIREIDDIATDAHQLVFDNRSGVEMAMVDEVLVNRILLNLLSNAIKYSPQGGTVTLVLEGEPEWWVLHVQDEGIGIPAEHLPHIFEQFYRADPTAAIDGTGLGLNTVQQCVDIHKGTITVDSEVNRGTTFTVRLPREKQFQVAS